MFDKIYLGAIIALVIIATGLFATVQYQRNKILTVTIERDNAVAAVKVKQLELDNSKEAQKTLEELLVTEKKSSLELQEELEVIRNEPETDNGVVSPILRRGIERLHNN